MSKLNWGKLACAVFILCATTAIALPAQTFRVVQSFDGTDGSWPGAGLVQATNGNLYGTTAAGGANTTGCYGNGCGTVFKITPSGTLTTLHSFCSQSTCTDGAEPSAALVQAADGNFYGTTPAGGAYGQGTVFKITPGGELTTLYNFCSQSNCTDGAEPSAALVQATGGNFAFYGTTYAGGSYGSGTVFKITPSGALTTLHSFCSQSYCMDGAQPLAGLIQATDGNFYGTTYGGDYNYGTVYKITPSGTLTTIYTFGSQNSDGANPLAGLVQAADGNFYGTTSAGGTNAWGTVFKITPTGTLTTLYSFCSQGGCTDGVYPDAGLVQATDGNLYGTTLYGGFDSFGTIFKITPNGTLTTLYNFCSRDFCTDGIFSEAGLIQDTNGRLYGTTDNGGAYGWVHGYGTVFTLSMGLGPFVETQPTSGAVGKPVKILGTNLTGATSVTFNGTQAVLKVVSSSLIITTVPQGATTGKVQVTTPGGVLTSNVPFRVRP
ncbi:MAG TPA: choice-of-anchor tandem repeat GloVer-containing protein [Terriglobia bacterium]|nr:choice-of-anchor tandem repeat GloVer-containing protein [Terriglobia bacterium]